MISLFRCPFEAGISQLAMAMMTPEGIILRAGVPLLISCRAGLISQLTGYEAYACNTYLLKICIYIYIRN